MLTRLRLGNFKSWRDTGDIAIKPITGFFGPNSSGKSSLIQALLLMKQTAASPDRGIVFHFGDEGALVNLGGFESVIHRHDTGRVLKFSLDWKSHHAFEIPREYVAGTVAKDDEVGFDVEIEEESIGSEQPPALKRMTYRIDHRRFGIRRQPGRMGYKLFARGRDFNGFPRVPEEDNGPRPSKFHEFPHWVNKYIQNDGFFSDIQYGMELLLHDLHYLGPIRAYPNRIYVRSGAQHPDMGSAGEFVIDAILSSPRRGIAVQANIAKWLKRLGLVHDFRVEALAENRRLFEVKVRKSPRSTEVLLTDVGFGVSQILPVLALCFYSPARSTVLLEQPDIHLHPSAQADLADVFIDAWKGHGVQILFESHSEHLLRRLQRRIAEEKLDRDAVGLFFCSTNGGSSSSIDELQVDPFGNISNWPNDFFGDQFGEIASMSEAAIRRRGRSG